MMIDSGLMGCWAGHYISMSVLPSASFLTWLQDTYLLTPAVHAKNQRSGVSKTDIELGLLNRGRRGKQRNGAR